MLPCDYLRYVSGAAASKLERETCSQILSCLYASPLSKNDILA